jgi:TPR repeat protein
VWFFACSDWFSARLAFIFAIHFYFKTLNFRGVVMFRRLLAVICLAAAFFFAPAGAFSAVQVFQTALGASVNFGEFLFDAAQVVVTDINRPDPAEECDALVAGSKAGVDNAHSNPSAGFENDDAIDVCWAAVAREPRNPHLLFQLARAFAAAKQGDEAAFFYRKAADLGSVTKTDGEGIHHKTTEAGYLQAVKNLVFAHGAGRSVQQNDVETARFYRKAADAGDLLATAALGAMYSEGRGVEQNDAEAFALLRKAADAGIIEATFNLALLYEDGRGVARDEPQASRLYRKAAEAGDIDSMYNLARMYEGGRGVIQDNAEAARLYRKAAEAGDAGSMYVLATLYEKGRGVDADLAEARKWYQKAAELGNEEAREALRYP